jgi:hypothetical protein
MVIFLLRDTKRERHRALARLVLLHHFLFDPDLSHFAICDQIEAARRGGR